MRLPSHKAKLGLLVTLLVILAGAAGWHWLGRGAAFFDGRPARFWLGHLPMTILTSGPTGGMRFYPEDASFQGRPAAVPEQRAVVLRERALVALRAIGTNALPVIMEDLVAQESPLRAKWWQFKAQHPSAINPSLRVLSPYQQSYIRMCQASTAVLEVGPLAEPLVPFLWKASTHTNGTIRVNARFLLCRIDPNGVASRVQEMARRDPALMSRTLAEVTSRHSNLAGTTNLADLYPHLP